MSPWTSSSCIASPLFSPINRGSSRPNSEMVLPSALTLSQPSTGMTITNTYIKLDNMRDSELPLGRTGHDGRHPTGEPCEQTQPYENEGGQAEQIVPGL